MARKESKRDIQIAEDGCIRTTMEFLREAQLAQRVYDHLGPERYAELEAAERRDVERYGDGPW